MEDGARLSSGILVVQFDGDGFHFCVFSQRVLASVSTEENLHGASRETALGAFFKKLFI